jgi:hypothetical protein
VGIVMEFVKNWEKNSVHILVKSFSSQDKRKEAIVDNQNGLIFIRHYTNSLYRPWNMIFLLQHYL